MHRVVLTLGLLDGSLSPGSFLRMGSVEKTREAVLIAKACAPMGTRNTTAAHGGMRTRRAQGNEDAHQGAAQR